MTVVHTMADRRRFVVRVLKFGVVGLTSVGIYFAFLVALRPLIMAPAALAAVCYALSAVANYVLQSRITFGRRDVARTGAIMRYAAMHGLCMAINSAIMHGLVSELGQNLYLSQIAATGVVAIVSFALSALWVYR